MKSLPHLGLLTLALASGSMAYTQTTTTGAIIGKVTDKTGAPLAGALVRAISNQVTRSATTDANGAFRISLLNPGAFQIAVSLNGYQTLDRQTIQVNLNEVATPYFKLAKVQETIVEVVAASQTVDTTSSQVGTAFSMDTIAKIPTGRSMESIALLAPGVVDSGMGGLFGSSISGASGAENAYYIDGVNTTDSRYGGSGTSLVTDFIDQVEVQTGGFKPEYNALGGVINVVTKSGTNDFKGSAWATWDPRGMVAAAKKTEWATQANPLGRYDVGAEVGGAIIKNKLFYEVGFDSAITTNPEVNTNFDGLSGTSVRNTQLQFFGKMNWFATQDLQFTFFLTSNPYKHDNDRDVPTYGDANTAYRQKNGNTAFSLSMDWNLRSDMILSAKLGQSGNTVDTSPVDPRLRVDDFRWYVYGPGKGATVPSGTAYRRGGGGYNESSDAKSNQARLDFTWFLNSHQLKAGLSSVSSTFKQNSWIGDQPVADTYAGMGGYVIIRANGSATTAPGIRTLQEAFFNAESKSKVEAFFVQDTWDFMNGIKASYGVRAENQELTDANGITFLKFGFQDELQPRLGLIWDLNNDGRSKLTANYAQYNEVFPLRYALRYRGGRYLYKRAGVPAGAPGTTYDDSTGAYSFDRSALGFSADYSSPYNDPPVQQGVKPPKRTEWVLGFERAIGQHWTLTAHGTYRKLTNAVEDMTPVDSTGAPIDGGSTGGGQAVLGNPRPGVWRWTANANSQTTPGQLITWDSSFPAAYNIYRSADASIEWKNSNHYLRLSYTWSRLYGNYEGVVSASNGQIDTNGTAAFDYPLLVGEGLLSTDRTHVVRLLGSHGFSLGNGLLTLGYNWSFQSGLPLSQYTGDPTFSGGPAVGNWTKPAPLDYTYYGAAIPTDFRVGQFGRSAFTNKLDLHIDYAFKAAGMQVVPSLDIFNALNERVETGLRSAYIGDGVILDSWGKPSGYQFGRSVRAGVKLRF
ncbi:Oar protein [Geothrix limicola]|uniref:Oar protein n=1 Tax=Geothrix limicola TaxID=2927978 RepID=A0ABQ5QAT6_9BACT|nr:TonB-dependent receptor [Geothrix limicola]GLH71703.1 Oar protein [Geothrix limicola]